MSLGGIQFFVVLLIGCFCVAPFVWEAEDQELTIGAHTVTRNCEATIPRSAISCLEQCVRELLRLLENKQAKVSYNVVNTFPTYLQQHRRSDRCSTAQDL